MPNVVVLGTCDTKLHELLYLRSRIMEAGGTVILVDAGRKPVDHVAITIPQRYLISKYSPKGENHTGISTLPRGEVIKYMISCATNWLRETYENSNHSDDDAGNTSRSTMTIHGIISAGGTGGTSLASGVMRAVLPLGFPKFIVSTNASADVSPVVGETDITMMPSIVDISGSNELLQKILANAAGAITGMARVYEQTLQTRSSLASSSVSEGRKKKRVGITMFGVTTPCCDFVRNYLESNYPIETFVFHCTGAGGQAMERLVREGGLDAVCDITTTELCDHIAGGVMSAGPDRLTAPLDAGIPHIISLGATDMVNFGPKATVPEKYRDRKLYEHNPTVTLMRTNEEECRAIGEFLSEKVRTCAKEKKNVLVVLPLGGVSVIATSDGPFHDQQADEALFAAVREGLKDSEVELVEDQRAINDESFATDLAKRLVKMMGL